MKNNFIDDVTLSDGKPIKYRLGSTRKEKAEQARIEAEKKGDTPNDRSKNAVGNIPRSEGDNR